MDDAFFNEVTRNATGATTHRIHLLISEARNRYANRTANLWYFGRRMARENEWFLIEIERRLIQLRNKNLDGMEPLPFQAQMPDGFDPDISMYNFEAHDARIEEIHLRREKERTDAT